MGALPVVLEDLRDAPVAERHAQAQVVVVAAAVMARRRSRPTSRACSRSSVCGRARRSRPPWLEPNDVLRAEQVPAVAGDVEEDHHAAVGLVPRLGGECDSGCDHPLVLRVEILDTQEQPDAAGELLADRRALVVPVGLREQQPRLSIRRPDHHPALGPALLGRQRRLVLHELKAKAIDEERDRLVVVVDDQREALEVHRPDGMGPRSGPESATTSLMARRRPRYDGPRRRAGSVLSESGLSRSHRGRGPRRGRSMRVLALLALAAAVLGGVVLWRSHAGGAADRRAAARRFATAWERRDTTAMWRALTPRARAADPLSAFSASYRQADRAAGVRSVRIGGLGSEAGGAVALTAIARTRDFGALRGQVRLPVSGTGDTAGVDWDASLRLPGLRRGEAVRRRSGRVPQRAPVLAADGTRLDATALGAPIAGHAAPQANGLERLYDERLGGHPAEQLLFGRRVVARVHAVHGRALHTTIRPALMQRAATALGDKLGGVAVVRPRDGAVLALAGLAVSAPQPPGSTFKIVTVSAALAHGLATPSSEYPVRTFATLSGVKLRNASGEACGGTLTQAFAQSCNSVFAPLGARIGARRLVATARAFGFGERLNVPAVKPSTISPVAKLPDSLAVGAAAIGQDRDLATPLEMASVGAAIAAGGRRARPRIATLEPVRRRRVVSPQVAHQVRAMMLDVVRSGTGGPAAIPGVEVAGKTGTAELRPNSSNPKDADAWFVAFAPAGHPRVAVAVMLVGAGFGGTAAAPIARQVLQAALGG